MAISRRSFIESGIAATTLAASGCLAEPKPGELIQRPIPASGETIPIIGLGSNRYGVDASAAARAPLRAALQRFHELGGRLIDTAPMYRSSETVLGDLISELHIRAPLFLATKTDKYGGSEQTHEQMQVSQQRLQTRQIDLMQVHNLRGWKEAMPVLAEWKQEGRIRYTGITTSNESQYEEFEQIMNSVPLDFIQVNYSLQQRQAAERLLPLAQDRGIAVIINRAFGGGSLFKTLAKQPLPDWAAEFDCASWAQFLLKYAISHPAATVAIPGMTKTRHVEDNMQAGYGRLPDPEQRRRQESFLDTL